MAITNKAELKRSALVKSASPALNYDQFVELAELYLNRALLPVRERETAGAAFVLAADTATNWLLTNAPDVYRAAVLVEAYLFTDNIDMAQVWKSRLGGLVDDLLWTSAREASQATLTVDPALIIIGSKIYDIATDDDSFSVLVV